MEVGEVVDGVWGCVGCIRFGDVAGWFFWVCFGCRRVLLVIL